MQVQGMPGDLKQDEIDVLQVYFSRVEKPSDAVKQAATAPAFVVLDSDVRVLRIKSTNPNHPGFLADKEICVNYRFLFFLEQNEKSLMISADFIDSFGGPGQVNYEKVMNFIASEALTTARSTLFRLSGSV